MVSFNFATAQKILFGAGRFAELGALAAQRGGRVCLVTGERSMEHTGRLAAIREMFDGARLAWTQVKFGHEPTAERVDEGTRVAREFGADVVIAIGGGSVIDSGKAIAALLANGGEVLDYIEGVGRGRELAKPSVPFIAVPTTAGTGSEATKNAVIGDEGHTFKKSMRADGMLPAVALVDPDLLADAPPAVIAACGMDAITQLLEAFTSRQASPIVDALAGLGLGLAARLPDFHANPADQQARESMALASLFGGIALANAGLGAVHGLASPLGAGYPIPHGVICATLLPAVVRQNTLRAAELHDDWLIEKYSAVAFQLVQTHGEGEEDSVEGLLDELEEAGEPIAVALALSELFKELNRRLGIPGLAHYGVGPQDIPGIIAGARGTSMKTNPVDLDNASLGRILEESL